MVFVDAFWWMLVGQNFSQDRAIFNPFLIPSIRLFDTNAPLIRLIYSISKNIKFMQIETPRLVSR